MSENKIEIPFNCFVDRDGFVLPKSAIVCSTPELKHWVMDVHGIMPFDGKEKFLNSEEPFIMITIGHSAIGNVYHTAWNESELNIKRFAVDDETTKWFYNIEAFKKYISWTLKLGKKFTRQLKDNK